MNEFKKINMSNLGFIKTDIMERIVKDDDICRALLFTGDTFQDEEFTQDQRNSLMFTHISPYPSFDTTIADAGSYISMSFESNAEKRPHKSELIKITFITFFIFCHRKIVN